MISIPAYRREWFGNIRGDLLSGLVVALALIPEAIAFSIIAGVDPKVFDRMKRSGHLDSIGPENVFVAGEAIYESSESALARAQDMLQRRMAAAQLETAGAQ